MVASQRTILITMTFGWSIMFFFILVTGHYQHDGVFSIVIKVALPVCVTALVCVLVGGIRTYF